MGFEQLEITGTVAAKPVIITDDNRVRMEFCH